ncbi:MAG TPA: hypothetical protein VMU60_05910 [Syntrophobacteria bacterium]|nr:hypothetical protein [Syntrophobacteria bacterium]
MVVEIAKTFRSGFILTEVDLERIVNDVSEQFRQRFDETPPKLAFTVRLRNGLTVSAYTLERILNEENLGESQIVRLEIDWYAPRLLDPTLASLVFQNAGFDSEQGDTSIALFVRGEPQGWVSATAAILEERIATIKRFTPRQLKERSVSRLASLIISPLIVLSLVLGVIHPLTANLDKLLWYTYTNFEMWNYGGTPGKVSGTISRASLEGANDNGVNQAISTLTSTRPFWVAVAAVLGLDLLLLFFLRYYPFYNFCWASAFRTFPRKDHARAFVFAVTAWTIATSFFYSIVANLTGKRS